MDEIQTLKTRFARNSRFAGWSGKAIVVGLALDIVVLLIFAESKFWTETLGAIFATLVIAAGVSFELHFGHKAESAALQLQQISDEKIADANMRAAEATQKAAEAQLELEKFRMPRRILMTPTAKSGLADKLKGFAGTLFDTGVGSGDGEQADALWDIEEILEAAGWKQLPWGVHGVGISVFQRNRRPIAGAIAAQNIEIHLSPTHRKGLLPAAAALIAGLQEIGIEAKEAVFNAASTNEEAMHILVGPKR